MVQTIITCWHRSEGYVVGYSMGKSELGAVSAAARALYADTKAAGQMPLLSCQSVNDLQHWAVRHHPQLVISGHSFGTAETTL